MMLRIFSLTLISIFLNTFPIVAEMPEPYRSIVDLPFDGQGWFTHERPLEAILKKRHPKIVIEIGSWLGCSTRFIASKIDDGAILYAIDTWKGSQNEDLHQKDPRLPNLYSIFLSNVKHAGLTDKIVPIRMESLEAARNLNVMADLIYIDASHDTASVKKDILKWYQHLKPGGVLCGDDWLWDSVRTAVVECAGTLGKRIYTDGNFWSYSEIPAQ